MMADLHIDDFYSDAAVILLLLYSAFPRRVALYVDDICGPDEPDEFGLPSPRTQAAFATILWLAEQGYLEFEAAVRQESVDQAVLTEKGFLALTSHADAAADNRPAPDEPSVLVHRLREARLNGSFALAEVVQAVLRRQPRVTPGAD